MGTKQDQPPPYDEIGQYMPPPTVDLPPAPLQPYPGPPQEYGYSGASPHQPYLVQLPGYEPTPTQDPKIVVSSSSFNQSNMNQLQPCQVIVTTPSGYNQKIPTDYTCLSWLVCLFCCWPVGLAAVIHSWRSLTEVAKGNMAGATAHARSAKKFIIIGVTLGVIMIVLISIRFSVIRNGHHDDDEYRDH